MTDQHHQKTASLHYPEHPGGSRDIQETEAKIFKTGSILFCLVFLPIPVFRTITESWHLSLIDWLIMLVSVMIISYGFFSQNTRVAAFLFISFLSCTNLAGIILIDPNLIVYALIITMVGFYLLPPIRAFITCGIPFTGLIIYLISINAQTDIPLIVFLFALNGVAVTVAVARHHLLEMAHHANMDPLTGVGNRRAMSRKLDYVKESRDIQKTAFSLLIVDFDHFKKINDTYGHDVGDNILSQAMTLLTERIRLTDNIFRFGGEEFVVILEGATAKDAEELAEELRQLIESSKLISDYQVTVSIGVAELLEKESISDWIRRGDKALFEAKNSGRNRTILSALPDSGPQEELPLVEKEFSADKETSA